MRVLIVKLSSLGDVVHTLPVAMDILRADPRIQVDWVVERGFAPLVARCQGVSRVIAIDLRQWRRQPWSAHTRSQWQAFRQDLSLHAYDAVLDLQGLTKSAWVAWLARRTPSGQRYAMANRTEGSGYERASRWVADVALPVPWHSHALVRGRMVAAQALGYTPDPHPTFGLSMPSATVASSDRGEVVLVHGTSRPDKEWPLSHWQALGERLVQAGYSVGLPHGLPRERAFAEQLARVLPQTTVWPSLDLAALTERMARSVGVIGVDSGLSHIAVALNLPHVQLYNFDTAWRTGPLDAPHQQAVFAAPVPAVDTVWHTWQTCIAAHHEAPL